MKTFASDNYSGVHPAIMEALIRANVDHAPSYGKDLFTERAVSRLKEHLGEEAEIFFVYNGTGANVLGLSAMTRSFHAIICSDLAHINVDESTAPENFLGCKLLTLPNQNGKITPGQIEHVVKRLGDEHHPQAHVVSISQPTEYGTVYTVAEIKAIADCVKKSGFLLHMDGARISNAAVSLGKSFREFTTDAGVDVLSFGGTKNGMMFGEAVVFLNKTLAPSFQYIRKQGMQLHSKMRFIGAQFEAFLDDNLWEKNARHANAMTRLLERKLKTYPTVTITRPVDANSIFAIMPTQLIEGLQKEYPFYVWDDKTNEVRLMCSFDTTEEEIDDFERLLQSLLKK